MKYAIIVIDADGATYILGPYSSESRARRDADAIHSEDKSVGADVYEMDRPSNFREYISEPERHAEIMGGLYKDADGNFISPEAEKAYREQYPPVKCMRCGLVANVDPSLHAERYGHDPAVWRDGRVHVFNWETYAFEPPN